MGCGCGCVGGDSVDHVMKRNAEWLNDHAQSMDVSTLKNWGPSRRMDITCSEQHGLEILEC